MHNIALHLLNYKVSVLCGTVATVARYASLEWTNGTALALNRSDASSWELRVVVSLGAPSSVHSLRSARHSSGPSAHYNA